jgi:hypothetical protein
MPERLDEEELADWRAGRNAVYQLAALTIGARLGVVDALSRTISRVPAMSPIRLLKHDVIHQWSGSHAPRASSSTDG